MKYYYKSDELRLYYYLYLELVDVDNAGNEYTFLCPRCYKAYKNNIYIINYQLLLVFILEIIIELIDW